MLFITCLCQFFSSRRMPKLTVVTTQHWQQQKSVLTGSIYQVLATLAVLAEGLLTQASESTPLWMDDKASSHCLKTRSIQKAWIILHSFIHLGIFIFMILISRKKNENHFGHLTSCCFLVQYFHDAFPVWFGEISRLLSYMVCPRYPYIQSLPTLWYVRPRWRKPHLQKALLWQICSRIGW